MGWWSRVLGSARKTANTAEDEDGIVHDMTFHFPGHGVQLVKQLADDFRVFLVGHGPGISKGDLVVVKTKGIPSVIVRYRIERISYRNEVWRAYGRIEHAPRRRVRSSHEKRSQARG